MVEPVSTVTAIIAASAAGLNLLDQARRLVLKIRGKERPDPAVTAIAEDDELLIGSGGKTVVTVSEQQVLLGKWDDIEERALRKKLLDAWKILNGIDARLPTSPVDEQVRLKARMEEIVEDLCRDFKRLLDIISRTMQIKPEDLEEYYHLRELCGLP